MAIGVPLLHDIVRDHAGNRYETDRRMGPIMDSTLLLMGVATVAVLGFALSGLRSEERRLRATLGLFLVPAALLWLFLSIAP